MDKRTRKLLRENNKSEKVLPKEASELLTDIVVYLRSSNLSMYNQELVRRDITQMLIEGNERGEYSKDIIGEDYEAFCDAIISELPKPTPKEKRIAFFEQTFASSFVMLILWAVAYLIDLIGDFDKWNGRIEFSFNSALYVICFLVLFEIFENKNKLVNSGITSLYINMFILCTVLLASMLFEAVSAKVLFSVHILVVVALIIILFAASTICENILDKKSGS